MGLDKQFLIEQLATRLKESEEVAWRSSEEAREARARCRTESEKKGGRPRGDRVWQPRHRADRAASRKAQEDLRTLSAFWNAGLPVFHAKSAVELGAIVDVSVESERGTEERTYILLPVGAGTELTGPGGDGFLSVITRRLRRPCPHRAARG